MNTLRSWYNAHLTPEQQDQFWKLIKEATMWRGTRGLVGIHPSPVERRIEMIADLFHEAGLELEEYT